MPYAERDDVKRFAAEVAARRGLDAGWVQAALEQARFVPNVARFIMPPPADTPKNWAAYRARFVEPTRIRAGAAFWRANERWLLLAEERYGVPPQIVVGIIGVESIYGQQMGNFRVIDALSTLAFDFPSGRSDRSAFFRDELESYFVLCRREGVDPLTWRGSYAGAIGMAQFMPSSINQYAVDFDGDGHIDLQNNPADAIGSVAHYLAEHGWTRGLPSRYAVIAPDDIHGLALLLAPDILPSFSASDFVANGARLSDAGLETASKLALVQLQNGDAPPSYVAGTTNFYAITRYNWSSYYALAVIELGEAVARERAGGGAVRGVSPAAGDGSSVAQVDLDPFAPAEIGRQAFADLESAPQVPARFEPAGAAAPRGSSAVARSVRAPRWHLAHPVTRRVGIEASSLAMAVSLRIDYRAEVLLLPTAADIPPKTEKRRTAHPMKWPWKEPGLYSIFDRHLLIRRNPMATNRIAAATRIDIGLDENERAAIAGGLSHLLADTYTLYLKTHNFHWNVDRPDVQHAAPDVHGAVHRAVERARSDRRTHPLARPSGAGTYARIRASSPRSRSPMACRRRWTWCAILVAGHEAVARTARRIFPVAEKAGDESTADLLTQRLQVHEQTAWMLRSLLEE